MIYRVFYSAGVLTAIALITACSGDQAKKQKRYEAHEYYRTTNTVIPADNEIISFPPCQILTVIALISMRIAMPTSAICMYIRHCLSMHLLLAPPPHRRTPTAMLRAKRSRTPGALKYNWHNHWISTR